MKLLRKLQRNTMTLIRFVLLSSLKGLRFAFFPTKANWIGNKIPGKDWKEVRLVLVLNHTSLFEYIFGGILPFRYLWQMAQHMVFPVAAETLQKKKIFKFILSALGPKVVPLSRKRDSSWASFIEQLDNRSILIFFPEGRMKRPSGLDKEGKPMTVRGGVLDVLRRYRGKKCLITYSGGLHHVFPPDSRFPHLFRSIKVALQVIDVDRLLSVVCGLEDEKSRKLAIQSHLEGLRDAYCPST